MRTKHSLICDFKNVVRLTPSSTDPYPAVAKAMAGAAGHAHYDMEGPSKNKPL